MIKMQINETFVRIDDLDIKFSDIKKQTWKMSFFQYTQSLNLVLKDKKVVKIKQFSMFSPAPYFDFQINNLISVLDKHDIPTTKFSESAAAELQRSIVILLAIIICVDMFFKSSLFRW